MFAAGFVSAPDLTAAAAAQNLTWAPVSMTAVTVSSYNLVMPTSSSALLTFTLEANLGVSGNISTVAPTASASGRRRLAQSSSSGKPMLLMVKSSTCLLVRIKDLVGVKSLLGANSCSLVGPKCNFLQGSRHLTNPASGLVNAPISHVSWPDVSRLQ